MAADRWPGYTYALRTAPDCIHGQQGGDIVRPWTGTPACPLCRRRHPVHWRRLQLGAVTGG
jgi:hypothetical protein